MDRNEVIAIIKEWEKEKEERHKKNGMWIEPVRHFNQHNRLVVIGDAWKKARVLIIAGVCMMLIEYFFDAHTHVANVFSHTHENGETLEVPDLPDGVDFNE